MTGSEWIRDYMKMELSELGADIADLLGEWVRGIYHLADSSRQRATWTNKQFVQIVIRGGISTWDFNEMTRLVFLAHDACLRVEMNGASNGYLRLVFSRRVRDSESTVNRHPALEEAVLQYRNSHPKMNPQTI